MQAYTSVHRPPKVEGAKYSTEERTNQTFQLRTQEPPEAPMQQAPLERAGEAHGSSYKRCAHMCFTRGGDGGECFFESNVTQNIKILLIQSSRAGQCRNMGELRRFRFEATC